MARPLRVEYYGAYYHVINRGNAGENIFIDERDKEKFLEYLAKGIERFTTRIHAYCLMSNHYHLLIETPQANLSIAIQWLNDEKEIPQLKELKPTPPINTIIQSVCDEFGCNEGQVKTRGRKDNKARAIAMYLARDLSGVSCKDIGAFFDGISGATITMKYNQMNAELMRNKKLRDKIATLKKQLLNI